MLLRHWACLALALARANAGSNMAARIAMMAMTTSSSMSVKAGRTGNLTAICLWPRVASIDPAQVKAKRFLVALMFCCRLQDFTRLLASVKAGLALAGGLGGRPGAGGQVLMTPPASSESAPVPFSGPGHAPLAAAGAPN